jgi:serine/threonine protein kinase
MPVAPRPFDDRTIFAGYTIVRGLGSGGMGEVCLARPPRLPRERYPDGMPAAEVAEIITAVADALDYAHQRNLLHSDVKPANVVVATTYCSTLQNTGASIWSLSQGDVASPTVTTAPTDEPLPIEEESPVRVCMQQTGRTRRQCREDIRRSNGLP